MKMQRYRRSVERLMRQQRIVAWGAAGVILAILALSWTVLRPCMSAVDLAVVTVVCVVCAAGQLVTAWVTLGGLF